MPSKTFLNLSKDKQKILIEAAEREFSRVDFFSSSINQIIQDAGISRGSFYMYFEDKEDLYFYVLEKHICTLYRRFLKYLDENAGDFIQAWHNLHTYILTSCLQKENSLFKNMFLNMRYTTDRKMSLKPPQEVIRKKHQELMSHIDKNKYRNLISLQKLPARLRMSLHAVCRADDKHRAVQHLQGPFHFRGKVHMSRRIKESNFRILPGKYCLF